MDGVRHIVGPEMQAWKIRDGMKKNCVLQTEYRNVFWYYCERASLWLFHFYSNNYLFLSLRTVRFRPPYSVSADMQLQYTIITVCDPNCRLHARTNNIYSFLTDAAFSGCNKCSIPLMPLSVHISYSWSSHDLEWQTVCTTFSKDIFSIFSTFVKNNVINSGTQNWQII